jgi:dTDP-4-dehydrorhamnose 3,5-epimerase
VSAVPRFREVELPGVLVVEPAVHQDARGFFLETYHRDKYRDGGLDAVFVQDNHSRSGRGTLRGLHAQRTRPQGKLVRAVRGTIFDVAVDVRRGSPTFGHWHGEELSGDDFRQLWIPPGFAHGFCVLSEVAEVEYKCTEIYLPEDEMTIAWDDPQIGVAWPLDDAPTLSGRDAAAPPLADWIDRLPVFPDAAARE